MELPELKFNIESRKKFNLTSFIKKRCQELNIEGTVTSEPVYRSFFEKIFSDEKETIFINLKGSEKIPTLCDDVKNYLEGIESTLK